MADSHQNDRADGDVFRGLIDNANDPSEAWDFNRWQATVLGGMTLSILLAVIGAGLHGRLIYTSVLLTAIALPTLIIYLMLESNRILLRSDSLKGLLGIGQTSAVLSLAAFVASYSWIAVSILIVVFAFWIWWGLRCLGPRLGAKWGAEMWFPEPQFHRTKMDRLLWGICATMRELNLRSDDIRPDPALGPEDFDGVKLNNVTFSSKEVEAKFQVTFRQKLEEAASVNGNATQ